MTTAPKSPEEIAREIVDDIDDVVDSWSTNGYAYATHAIAAAISNERDRVIARLPSEVEISREYARKGMVLDFIRARLEGDKK